MALYLESKRSGREFAHGQEAINIALGTRLFQGYSEGSWSITGPHAAPASQQDLQNITRWCDAMSRDAASRKAGGDNTILVHSASDGSVTAISDLPQTASTSGQGSVAFQPTVQEFLDPVEINRLKPDQRRAFEIVKKHFLALQSGKNPKQLLMQIQGEGGTGKSMVIHCITILFKNNGMEGKLIRCAYTGVAASLIDGNTLHTLCRLTRRKTELIIDEVSMISRDFLERVSNVLQKVKQRPGEPANILPFGGIHVIIAGDFHQFPPEVVAGRDIYEQFKTVVVLQDQCRTTDKDWLAVLRHARTGTCSPVHLAMIRGLVINVQPGALQTASVDDPEWQNAVLVTPRHAVRLAWNRIAVRRHCAKYNRQLLICPAEDTIGGRRMTIADEYYNAKQKRPEKGDRSARKEKADLPDTIELAIGLEVMVTYNVETDLDVTNGARGVVEDIILDRRERPVQGMGEAATERTLMYPPECVLVKLTRTKAQTLPDLPDGVVPIVPMERKYDIRDKDRKRHRVTRRQLPMTAAYAFTDYRSQGQTIQRVIVDIGRPPTGGLTPFNAYVALSRSSGRDSIRLLRDFDDRLFTNCPSEALRMEDMRLMYLHSETKRRWEAVENVWEHEGTESDLV